MRKRSKVETIMSRFQQELLNQLESGFTGDISLSVNCNQGGIRNAKKATSKRVDGGFFVSENVLL
jgi:hypothetical protein